MNIYEKLSTVQSKLKVSKENFNAFGKYKYRSCEDILEGVKPLLKEVKAIVTLTDSIELIGDRYYLKATATIIDSENEGKVEVSAYAREDLEKKGMDLAQVTGSVSSYARKYALNGLFCIDDTKDSDATNKHGKEDPDEKQMLNEKISLVKAKTLEALIKDKGKDLNAILKYYKVPKINELTAEQAAQLQERLLKESAWNES